MPVAPIKLPILFRPSNKDFGLYTFQIGSNTYNNLSAEDALQVIIPYALDLRHKYQAGLQWHRSLLQEKLRRLGHSAIGSRFSHSAIPDMSIWNDADVLFRKLSAIPQNTDQLPVICRYLAAISGLMNANLIRLRAFAGRPGVGIPDYLEVLVLLSEAGEVSGPSMAAKCSWATALPTLRSESIMHPGSLRDKPNWWHAGTDSIQQTILSLVLDQLALTILREIKGMTTEKPLVIKNILKYGDDAAKKAIMDLLAIKTADSICQAIQSAVQSVRNSSRTPGYQELSDAAVRSYTLGRNIRSIMATLWGRI